MKLLLVLSVISAPCSALACAVCLGNNEENAAAFLIATVLLTVLPLAVILGSIRWAQSKMEARDEEARRQFESSKLTQQHAPSASVPSSRTFSG